MTNTGFELGLADWKTFTGTETITSDAFAGTNALALSSNGSGVDQRFSVVAGETYTLSTYGKTSATAWSGVGLRFYDAQWNALDNASAQVNSTDWTEYTVDAIAPTGAVNGIIWAWKGGDPGTTTLDEFGVSGFTPPPPSDDNLLTNPSFEFGLTNWNAFSGNEAISTDAVDGTQSLELSTSRSGVNQRFEITPGETYQLTAQIKSDNNGWNGIGLRFRDTEGNPLLTEQSQISNGDWSLYDLEGTAPDNATQAEVFIWNGGDSGSTYLDDVSFSSVSTTPANQLPMITSNGGSDGATLSFAENGTGVIANINTTDADGDTEGNGLTYTLNGPDISQIAIDPNTGELSFNTAPDYENPSDSNGDNQYNVTAVVTDSEGGQDRQAIAINVTDIDETPIDTTAPTANLTASDITTAVGNAYTFSVTYTDDSGVDLSSLDSGDITVRQADGSTQRASLAAIANNTATYQIAAPGGRWNGADSGSYTIQLLANQVTDVNGNTMPATTLGSFDVDLNASSDAVIVDSTATRYRYDAGTTGSPVADGWQRLSPNTTGDINWDGRVGSVDRGSVAGVNDLTRDMVWLNGSRTLSHKIENGVWNIAATMGDIFAHGGTKLSAEGTVLNANFDNATGEFPVVGGQVTVTDGVLDLTFESLGGINPAWVLNQLVITKASDLPTVVDTIATRYDYDFGTNDSPVASGWQRISPFTTGDISWDFGVASVDRGAPVAELNASNLEELEAILNGDLVYSGGTRTLSHNVPNGLWNISATMGDTAAHDNMKLSAEGIVLNARFDNAAGEFPVIEGQVTVTDGVLELTFEDLAGPNFAWVLNQLTLTPGDNSSELSGISYKYDFGPDASPVADTWQRVSPNTTPEDITWSAPIASVDRRIANVDQESQIQSDVERDLVYSSGVRNLSHKIANGIWNITLNMGDTFGHDRMQVSAEGSVLNADFDNAAGEFPFVTGQVTVTDGILDLTFEDLGGTNPHWVLNRMSLDKVSDLPTVTSPPTLYQYDAGTTTSPVAPGWERLTNANTDTITWSAGLGAGDRGAVAGVTDLTRDFVWLNGIRTLSHDIDNGVWNIAATMGDIYAHGGTKLSAEGTVLNANFANAAGEFPVIEGQVSVTDGVLDLTFESLGGVNPAWVLNQLVLTKVSDLPNEIITTVDTTATRYSYDFGTVTSPQAAGMQRISPDTAGDIRWSGEVQAIDRGLVMPPVSDGDRDFIYSSETRTLSHDISNGVWDITLTVGDQNAPHDQFRITAEGLPLERDLNTFFTTGASAAIVDSQAGQFLNLRQRVLVTDGVLDLTFEDLGGLDLNWVATRLVLNKVQDLPDEDPNQPTANGLGFTREAVVSGLDNPLSFAYADDGRIFVAEKDGRVKIVEDGQVVSTFLDINEEVNSYWDRGLKSIALDPDFENNGWVYLNFVVDLNPETPDLPQFSSPAGGRLIKIKASADNPNVADLSSRVTILDGHKMTHATHSVGDVDFDNDGNLIFSWGDGGFGDNLRFEAQDPDSKQGKFFRIDPETGFGLPDNPFYDPANPDSVRSKVWALGVRNPWVWTVDRPTGDVYFADVTDAGPEEANILRTNITNPDKELNFGWPYFEGDVRTRYGTVPDDFVYESSYVTLPHTGGYDAITGGAVYRGTDYPEVYNGRYFFANYGQNTFYTADEDGNFRQFGNFGDYGSPVDIQMAPNGTLQYLSLFDGTLYQLNYDPSTTQPLVPRAEATASVTAGVGPLTVNFNSDGSNSPNGEALTYAWDFDADGTVDSTEANPSFTYTTVGRQTATLTITDAADKVDTTEVEVTIVSTPPNDGNLALGRPTVQSSTAAGRLASRAVDGNTDGTVANGSVATTAVEDKAFWEIDLGAVYDLSSVQLFIGNQPLANYYVLVSESEFTGGNLSALLEEDEVWAFNDGGEVTDETAIAINQTGRYLRVQLAETDFISLSEVKIFGDPI